MDSTEKGALKFCNEIIAEWDGKKQRDIAPGYRVDASHCPISMTIRKGLALSVDPRDHDDRVITGTSRCHVVSENRERDVTYHMTRTAARFAAEFDNHLRPAYEVPVGRDA